MSADSEAAAVSRPKLSYAGPGLIEWLLGAFCTAFIGDAVSNWRTMDTPQTAPFYYAHTGGVMLLQWGQVLASASVILLVFVWIVSQKSQSPLKGAMQAVSALGCGLIWAELLIARSTQPSRLFILSDLPYRPVGSWGILGAQVFLTYLVFGLPDGKLNPWMGALLKAAFSLCIWMVQLTIWSMIWKG